MPLAAVPVEEVVSAVPPQPAVEEVLAPSVPEPAHAEVADSTDLPAPAVAGDEQADSLLADLDRATTSLVGFREEIGRLVQLQRTTASELEESRRQLAEVHDQTQDYGRLEAELSQQRSLVTSVRAKLNEAIASLDGR
jgi:hypothetical protein